MTEQEIQAEWLNRRETRLGVLCGSGDPTTDQLEIAAKEADEWRKGWEGEQEETMWI